MTFDGVPLNDAEDSAVYTVDYANLVGSVQNLQIQRGVGTSTVGAAAFAGSIKLRERRPRGPGSRRTPSSAAAPSGPTGRARGSRPGSSGPG